MPWWLFLALVLLAALPSALSLALAAGRARQQRRLEAAATELLPTDVCLACEAHDVEPIAPEVARCRACGFVGGQGMAAWQRQRQDLAYAQMGAVERCAAARQKLTTARIHLSSAGALLERATTHSRLDMAGLTLARGREKQALWAEAEAEMATARALASEAAALTNGATPSPAAKPAISGLSVALDTSWLGDSLGVDLAVHQHIKRTRAELGELLAATDRQLAALDALVDTE